MHGNGSFEPFSPRKFHGHRGRSDAAACGVHTGRFKLDKCDDDDDGQDSLAKGLFSVTGSDAVGPLSLTLGSYGLVNGEVIELSLKRQAGVVELTRTNKSGIRRFRVGAADAFILAKDGAKNSTQAFCPVTPRDHDADQDRKNDDDRKRDK